MATGLLASLPQQAQLLQYTDHIEDQNFQPQSLHTNLSSLHQYLQNNWLIASPYVQQQHLLDLDSLDIQDRLFALALTSLASSNDNFATERYEQAFDWDGVMTFLRSLADQEHITWTRREYYVVEFRSHLKPDIDVNLLFKLDKESHAEATQSGGLLKYWYGRPDAQRRNLATCLWRNKEDAIKGGQGAWHRQARAVIPQMYESISVKGLSLVVEEGARAWQFSAFSERGR